MPGRPFALVTLTGLLLAGGCTRPPAPGRDVPDAAVLAEPEGELPSTRPAGSATRLPGHRPAPLTVTASGTDGHLPAAAVDGDLGTRWSQYGRGAWLQADLGTVQHLQAVDVAWHRGDRRAHHFTVEVSGDGATFEPVFTGLSSGRTLAPERYAFRPVPARYVRLTVAGNSENDWVSIDEVAVETAPAPTPAG